MGEESPSGLAQLSMFRMQCPICEHANPADARFCNACGAPLYLAPCPRCGAMNDLIATECHECGVGLAGQRTGALARQPGMIEGGTTPAAAMRSPARASEPAPNQSPGGDARQPVGEPAVDPQEKLRELRRLMDAPIGAKPAMAPQKSRGDGSSGASEARGAMVRASGSSAPGRIVTTARPLPPDSVSPPGRRRSIVIAGTLALAACVVLGYYAYRKPMPADSARAPAASSETKARVGSTGSGAIVNTEAPAPRTPPASTPGPVESAAVQDTKPPAPPPERGAAATSERSVEGVEARRSKSEAKDAPAVSTTPPVKPSAALARSPEGPRSTGRVTERSPDAAAAEAVLTPRPQAPSAGVRIEPPPPRLGPCTEALAALGLCTLEPNQRRD